MGNPLKRAILGSLRASGALALSTRLRRGNTLVILCYHGISLKDEHEWSGGLYITPALFRRRLEFLRSWGANVLPLGEAVDRLRAGSLPARSVVLTFDDGFFDFYHHAFPVIQEFGYPCTVYLTTWYSQFRLPVFNLMMNYLLWKSGKPEYSEAGARDREVAEYRRRTSEAGLDAGGNDRVARQFAESIGLNYENLLEQRLFQIMSAGEVAAIAARGIDIQLHTHRHRTPADPDLFSREIRENAENIEKITGARARHFCYPSGVTSPEFLPWLNDAGVLSATTCVHGLATAETNPLLLPRYLDGCGVTDLDFESWLSGLR